MADRKKKFAAEKKRMEDEMEEIKQSSEVGTCFIKSTETVCTNIFEGHHILL